MIVKIWGNKHKSKTKTKKRKRKRKEELGRNLFYSHNLTSSLVQSFKNRAIRTM